MAQEAFHSRLGSRDQFLMRKLFAVSVLALVGVVPCLAQPSKMQIDPRKALGSPIDSVRLKGLIRDHQSPIIASWAHGRMSITFTLGPRKDVRSILIRETPDSKTFESNYAFLDYAQAFLKGNGMWNRWVKFRALPTKQGDRRAWTVNGMSGLRPGAEVTLRWFKNELQVLFEEKLQTTRAVGTGNLMAKGPRKAFQQPKEFAALGCHLFRSPTGRSGFWRSCKTVAKGEVVLADLLACPSSPSPQWRNLV